MVLLLLLACFQVDLTPGDNCASGSWHTLSDGFEVCGSDKTACLMECEVQVTACKTQAGPDDLPAQEACFKTSDTCRPGCE